MHSLIGIHIRDAVIENAEVAFLYFYLTCVSFLHIFMLSLPLHWTQEEYSIAYSPFIFVRSSTSFRCYYLWEKMLKCLPPQVLEKT